MPQQFEAIVAQYGVPNEQEVKDIVEQIASLDVEADVCRDKGDDAGAGFCTRKSEILEKELETQGYMLADEGEEIQVYRASALKVAGSLWLTFDTANWQWVDAPTNGK